MSTLAIPPKRVQLYRVLWDRWIIVLRILLDLGAGSHPVRWRAVADTLLVDKKTAQKYIMGLVRDGHITTAGDGYMLTQAGMDALLENSGGGDFLPLEGKNPGENFSPLVVEVVDSESELKQLTTTTTSKLGKNPGENFSPLALHVIQHIPDIFSGSELTINGLPPLVIDEILLGWVAYAYDKRTSLNAPVGLIHSKLKRDERPPMEYVKNYVDYLPETFLEVLGLIEFECGYCHTVFETRIALEEHEKAEHPYRCMECNAWFESEDAERAHYDKKHNPDRYFEKQQAELAVQPDIMAGKTWARLLAMLKDDMPRASFETWVQDSKAIGLAGGLLTVAVRNSYARDWLESRLQSTVERLLVGILNAQVKVEFVVAVETEA